MNYFYQSCNPTQKAVFYIDEYTREYVQWDRISGTVIYKRNSFGENLTAASCIRQYYMIPISLHKFLELYDPLLLEANGQAKKFIRKMLEEMC